MKIGIKLTGSLLFILLVGALAFIAALKLFALNSTMVTGISIVFLLFLAAIAIGLRTEYSITHPIQKLTRNIEDISKGKLDIHVEGKERTDEIGELAKAFDRILVSLKLAVEKVGLKKEELKLGEALEAKERAEHLKKELEARYRVLAQTSPDCIVLLDTSGKSIFMNESAIKHYRAKESCDAEQLARFLQDDYKPKLKSALAAAKHGKMTTFEGRYKEGSHLWSLETISPIKNNDGSINSILILSRNITPLKKTEDELRSQKDFVEALIEKAGVPVLAFDTHDHVLIANNTLTKLTGYQKKDLHDRDKGLSQIFPKKEVRQKILDSITSCKKNQVVKDLVIPIHCKDGSNIMVVANLTLVDNALVFFMRDLSEIFTLEHDIRSWINVTEEAERPPASIEITPKA